MNDESSHLRIKSRSIFFFLRNFLEKICQNNELVPLNVGLVPLPLLGNPVSATEFLMLNTQS